MYGIGTVYQRLKGVVPPSTEAQQQAGAGGPGGCAAAAGTELENCRAGRGLSEEAVGLAGG